MLEKPFAIVSSIIKFNSRNFIWMTAAKSGEKFVFNTLLVCYDTEIFNTIKRATSMKNEIHV